MSKKRIHAVAVAGMALSSLAAIFFLRRRKNKLLCENEVDLQSTYKQASTKFNDNKQLRISFNEEKEKYNSFRKKPDGHTHPISAIERDSASQWMSNFILDSEYQPFGVNPSQRFIDKGYRCISTPYWGKDLTRDVRNDKLQKRSFFHLVDVDYHIDDLLTILRHERPVIMYTYLLSRISGQAKEQVWYWTSKSGKQELNCIVNGGGTYHHQLWD